jgi:hypothetical protein
VPLSVNGMSNRVSSPAKYASSWRMTSANGPASRRRSGRTAGAFRCPGMDSEVKVIPSPTSSRSPSGLEMVVQAVIVASVAIGSVPPSTLPSGRDESWRDSDIALECAALCAVRFGPSLA